MESSSPPPRVDIANRPRATSRIDPRRVDDVSLSSAIEQRTVADFFNGGRYFRPRVSAARSAMRSPTRASAKSCSRCVAVHAMCFTQCDSYLEFAAVPFQTTRGVN